MDLRKLANEQATIDSLLQSASVLERPTQDLYRDRLRATRQVKRWYEAPRHLPGKEAPIKVGLDQATGASWQRTLQNLEGHLRANDLQSFYNLVNRLCQLKPSSPLISGLELESGETTFNRTQINKIIAADFTER